MSKGDLAALRATVRGRVQGVGFRFFVEREANALGLTGFVRNRPDGSVEVVAEGDRAALDALLRELHDGPRMAIVEGVNATWKAASGAYASFGVLT